MEEDIKILEDLKEHKWIRIFQCENRVIQFVLTDKEIQAIENVLAELKKYKEREKYLNERYKDNIPDYMYISLTKLQYKDYLDLKDGNVSKAKIKAKIEELEKQIKEYQKESNYPRGRYVNSIIIEVLEELLEG